jgi:hypothetical protein
MDNDPAHPWYEAPDAIQELTEVREIGCGALSVVVDFNDLLTDKGDEAYEIVAKLKDLLA